MNDIKTISNGRKVGGDYFKLIYNRKSKKYLSDYITEFRFNDYYCYKSSRHQILISYEDFIEFKHSQYVFFNKELYNKEHIDLWVEYMISIGGMQFMTKPLPPFHPSKIIIKK